MSEIRIAIVGVGNCTSSLVQGTFYYEEGREEKKEVSLNGKGD